MFFTELWKAPVVHLVLQEAAQSHLSFVSALHGNHRQDVLPPLLESRAAQGSRLPSDLPAEPGPQITLSLMQASGFSLVTAVDVWRITVLVCISSLICWCIATGLHLLRLFLELALHPRNSKSHFMHQPKKVPEICPNPTTHKATLLWLHIFFLYHTYFSISEKVCLKVSIRYTKCFLH